MKTNLPELDKDLFRQTFSKVKASPDTLKEAIKMTEMQSKPKKFILRRLAVAALVLALAFALAMGANAATNGELFKTVSTFVTIQDDGSAVTWAVNQKSLENTSEDAPLYFEFADGNGSHSALIYKDEDGNFTIKEDLPEGAEDSLNAFAESIQSEARGAVEAE